MLRLAAVSRSPWKNPQLLAKARALQRNKFAGWQLVWRKNCDCHVSVLMPDYAHSVNLVEFLVGRFSEG
jgi:hypothetical protein